MRVVIVSASGVIGKALVKELGARHEIVRVGRISDACQAISWIQ